MGRPRWLDWAYYGVILGAALFSLTTGLLAAHLWGMAEGWTLLGLWALFATTVLTIKLRADRRERRRLDGQ